MSGLKAPRYLLFLSFSLPLPSILTEYFSWLMSSTTVSVPSHFLVSLLPPPLVLDDHLLPNRERVELPGVL